MYYDIYCRLCRKPLTSEGEEQQNVVTIDYAAATGRKTYPSMKSPNYDYRYGFLVPQACYTRRMERLQKG